MKNTVLTSGDWESKDCSKWNKHLEKHQSTAELGFSEWFISDVHLPGMKCLQKIGYKNEFWEGQALHIMFLSPSTFMLCFLIHPTKHLPTNSHRSRCFPTCQIEGLQSRCKTPETRKNGLQMWRDRFDRFLKLLTTSGHCSSRRSPRMKTKMHKNVVLKGENAKS